ncbi:MAG: hypothetical protein LUD50_07510 [Clostridia bacterium]|nr:hypothetical protein [Clostridia bacterium]
MRYLRTITVVVIAFVFLAALAIGLGAIFAVRNINITIETYTETETEAEDEIAAYKAKFMDLYKGKLINRVSEEDIVSDLAGWDDCNYVLEADSFSKVLPCTINITLLERRETYVFDNGDGTYNVYDIDGALIRVAESEAGIMNTTSGEASPNVMLYIPDETYVETAAYLGKEFQTYFSASFDTGAPIRSTIEWIEIEDMHSAYLDSKAIFHLRSGIEVQINSFDTDLETKMSAAYDVFKELGPEEKLTGYIHCMFNDDGILIAKYEPKNS